MLACFRKWSFCACAVILGSCSEGTTGPPVIDPPPTDTIPPVLQREMRGLWIATVANIDWPSRTGLTTDQQRAELIDLLSRAASTGINTIIFHVRPAGDAVYQSSLE